MCSRFDTPTTARHREHTVYCQVCGGTAVRRPDDTPDAIERRLATYEEQTGPLLGFFREKRLLVEVESLGSPEEVFERLICELQPILWGTGEAVS